MLADLIPKIAGMEAAEENSPYTPRPSMAGPTRCKRKMYYHSIDAPKKSLPGRFFLVMDDSSWHEELTADWIRKSNFSIHSQQMHINIPMIGMEWLEKRNCPTCLGLIPDGCIGAHVDGFISPTHYTMQNWLYEHKAINHFTFKNMWEEENYPIDYFYQVGLYSRGTQLSIDDTITNGVLLIKNKNTAQYLEFLFEYCPIADVFVATKKTLSTGESETIKYRVADLCKNASERFNFIHNCTEPPARDYTLNDWQCDYCSWNGLCWEGYERDFPQLKTSVTLEDEVKTALDYMSELRAERLRVEKAESEAKDGVIKTMMALDARTGVAGDYIVERVLRSRKIPDTKNIPSELFKIVTYEQLRYSKPTGARREENEGN